MRMIKKPLVTAILLVMGIGMAHALPKETCSCESGTMTVEFTDGGGVSMSCSGGGKVICTGGED